MSTKDKIAVIGLGYVGLPLAVEFGKKYPTVGFDIQAKRIDSLREGVDVTLEVEKAQIEASTQLSFTDEVEGLAEANIYIVTVPTPIDENNNPDLDPLENACRTVATVLEKGDLVIFESTVFPGCTEEVCVPLLQSGSGLSFNSDFFCGYSPERINPGDKQHTLTHIRKVTSGSTPEIADRVDALYTSIISAGTYRAESIRVAEAAKVIENCQRDINIAFVNELALIFERLGIDTLEVLEAAGSKWNFLPFRPGLVGGHCIGVDPYYLTYKAQQVGYHPEVILSGRRINDAMGAYVAKRVLRALVAKEKAIKGARVLMLGVTFKENCPDIRNSRVVDVYHELRDFGLEVDVYDPWADPDEVRREYGIEMQESPGSDYAAVVLAVAHREFANADPEAWTDADPVVFDIKSLWPRERITERL